MEEDKDIRIEKVRIPREDMKKIMTGHIGNLDKKDFINFQISYIALPGDEEFVKSFSITVEKDVEENECDCEDCGG